MTSAHNASIVTDTQSDKCRQPVIVNCKHNTHYTNFAILKPLQCSRLSVLQVWQKKVHDHLHYSTKKQILPTEAKTVEEVINTHLFNGPFSGTTQVSRYQTGKTNLDFTETRDSEWQWHQLGHMQVCTLLQTDNHTSTPQLSFLQARCPSCRPTNSIKALKARSLELVLITNFWFIDFQK